MLPYTEHLAYGDVSTSCVPAGLGWPLAAATPVATGAMLSVCNGVMTAPRSSLIKNEATFSTATGIIVWLVTTFASPVVAVPRGCLSAATTSGGNSTLLSICNGAVSAPLSSASTNETTFSEITGVVK